MSQYVFSNNAVTTLGSNLSPSATTLTVATGTGSEFPTPTPGQVVSLTLIASGSTTGVPNEIVYATARTGDTFTVVRGQEGTTAQSWSSGDTVANMATAEFYNEQASTTQIQKQSGNYAVDSGAANSGVVSLAPAPANQAALIGVPIRVKKMANPNTGAYVLNVNGFGAQAVTIGGRPMENAQLLGSSVFEVMWDGAAYELISNPAVISNSGLAVMAMETIKANITGSPAAPQDVSLADFLTFLGVGDGVLGGSGFFTIPVLVAGVPTQVIVQWGTVSFTTDATVSFSWPTPFLSSCFLFNPGQQQGYIGSNPQNNITVSSQVLSNSGYSAQWHGAGDHVPITLNWIAIGV